MFADKMQTLKNINIDTTTFTMEQYEGETFFNREIYVNTKLKQLFKHKTHFTEEECQIRVTKPRLINNFILDLHYPTKLSQ